MPSPEAILRGLFNAAVAAAAPSRCVPRHLPLPPRGRTIVVGAGKAAAAMARAVEIHWPGPVDGFVVTASGHGVPCKSIAVVEASHPMPDTEGLRAARRALDLVSGLGPDDLVLALISGGGSALLPLPAPGLDLDDKRAVTAALLGCGATIAEINTVRKHLSAIKGGRLAAAAAPARVVTLVISDVPGDDPATVASGPTLPDPTTFADARAVLAKYGIDPPEDVRRRLAGVADETPKHLDNAEAIVIARAADALQAAAAQARSLGIEPIVLGDNLQGEAARLAAEHAKLAREARGPRVILSGGETTVTLAGGSGRGGRNTEYVLGLGLALNGTRGIFALAADTDGIDGDAGGAGAILRPGSLIAARSLGLDPAGMAAGHDSATLFAALGDVVVTGPTRTNVNDFRAILILH
jgi:hydroxypyruvate reductase